MNAPGTDQIIDAVLAWQRRAGPLAQRLDESAVHSIGVVALPFLRAAAEEAARAPTPWRGWLQRLPRLGTRFGSAASPTPCAAFSEPFIDGISPAQAAEFARRHGVEDLQGTQDWPQRRIEVDARRTESSHGGWPFELWLVTAAVEGRRGRHRVLLAPQAVAGHWPVLGRRHWRRDRLALAGLLALSLAAGAAWLGGSSAEGEPPQVRVAGAVTGGATPASAAPPPASDQASAIEARSSTVPAPAGMPASTAASTAQSAFPAAAPALASAAAGASAVPAASPAMAADATPEQGTEPLIDIRPRLGPRRGEERPRPPLRALPPAAAQPTAAASSPPAPSPVSRPEGVARPAAPDVAADPNRPDPERVRPRWADRGGSTVAIVSPPYARRAEAQAMLERMHKHLRKTLPEGAELGAEVFETPQGYRAALFPFASREEAQILNATLVARGWRTRAVDF